MAVVPAPGEVLGPALRQRVTMLAERLGTTRVWHVSSTATGGGVARRSRRSRTAARPADGEIVDPPDYPAFGKALDELLRRPGYAAELGKAARRDCQERFLFSRELSDSLSLSTRMLDA